GVPGAFGPARRQDALVPRPVSCWTPVERSSFRSDSSERNELRSTGPASLEPARTPALSVSVRLLVILTASRRAGYRPFGLAGFFTSKLNSCLPDLTSTLALLPGASGGIRSAGSMSPVVSPLALAAASFSISSLLRAKETVLTATI